MTRGSARRGGATKTNRATMVCLLALPGAAVLWTAFRGGGFFVGTQAVLVVAVALALALWLALAHDPLAGAGRALVVSAGALALFASWALASAAWSNSPARAIIEFDRALLYLLTLVLFGLLPITTERLRWMVRGLAAAMVAVCAVAITARLAPDLFPAAPLTGRLQYPITYENSLGLLGALAAVLALHLTSSAREPPAVRVFAAAAIPFVVTTTFLTLSRAAIYAGVAGLALYLALARPRLALSALLATVPGALIALRAASAKAEGLIGTDPDLATAVSANSHLGRVLLACVVFTAAARALLLRLDERSTRRAEPLLSRRQSVLAVSAAGALAAVGFLALGGPAELQRRYEAFVKPYSVVTAPDITGRLGDPAGTGRADFWRVALDAFVVAPWRGHGAGTYQLFWQRDRPYLFQIFDAHSLYLETLAELGVIGFLLLGAALLVMLAGMARRVRGPDRCLYAAILTVSVVWALRAGVDWDWEMPVVTLWLFALGGALLAAPPSDDDPSEKPPADPPRRTPWGLRPRLAAAAGCVVLAVLPLQLALSQEHLNRTVGAFENDDCSAATREARASIAAIDLRPEPYELLGYCQVRAGDADAAVATLRSAVALDPDNWQYHYGLALVTAAAGLDPRRAARHALALNPREPLARDAVTLFATDDPALWRSRAGGARLPEL